MTQRRQLSYAIPPLTPVARNLIIALTAIFLAQVLLRVALGFDTQRYARILEDVVGLSAHGTIDQHWLWQPLTYFWIAPMSLVSVLLSLLMIWIFAPPIEQRVGGARMLVTFAFAGIAGGLLTLAAAAIAGPGSTSWHWVSVGAHGATAGLAAFLFWLKRDHDFDIFVARAKGLHLLLAFTALNVLQGFITLPIAAATSIGGILAGVIAASGVGPWRLWQQFRLWRIRRRVRTIAGGKDDRHFLQ